VFSKRSSSALVLSCAALFLMAGLAQPVFGAWSLIWSDEFNGASLNTSTWNYAIGTGCPDLCGWGNNELQFYRSENVSVSGGNLIITARDENYGGASFTSGRIHTRGNFSFLYGRIEMRAKIPSGEGLWPAFWMMPEDDVYGGWAASGEIDIMEAANATTSMSGALHFGGQWPDNTYTSDSYSIGGASFADEFRVYAVEWEEDQIRWYVDGVLFMTRNSSQWWSANAPGNSRAPFDQEFYILLNTAVGGWYPGCTSPGCITADLPQEYLIDYVRVYQQIDNLAPEVTITSPLSGSTQPAGDILIAADVTDPDGSIIGVEFYNGTTLLNVDTSFPYQFTWTGVADGCYEIAVRATDNQNTTTEAVTEVTVGLGCGQLPFSGNPFLVPGLLQAEDFDIGGEGVASHDTEILNQGGEYRTGEGVDIEACSDVGGGYNVGWTMPGEWIEYTLVVPQAGDYLLDLRVAARDPGKTLRVLFNGMDRTGEVALPHTGGWQNWDTVTVNVALEAGVQTMRLVPVTGDFNLNFMEFRRDVSDVPLAGGPAVQLHPNYPNPFNPSTTLAFELAEPRTVNLGIYDVSGRLVRQLLVAESSRAGRHEVVWNGRDDAGRVAPTGAYFYRLQAGDFNESRRMVLIK
jgi:beta-glucanase (GH16 family)